MDMNQLRGNLGEENRCMKHSRGARNNSNVSNSNESSNVNSSNMSSSNMSSSNRNSNNVRNSSTVRHRIAGCRVGSWMLAVLVVVLAVWQGGYSVQALTPRVMLADYSVEEGSITAGEPFTLRIVLANKAVRTSVRNLKVTVISENGEFLPTEGAGTAYLERIDPNTEAELLFPLLAIDGLEEKSYKVSIKTEYEDPSGNSYEVTDAIYLPEIYDNGYLSCKLFPAAWRYCGGECYGE